MCQNWQMLPAIDDSHPALERAREQVDRASRPAILLSRDYRILHANRSYRERYQEHIRLGEDRCHQISHRYEGPCDEHGETCPLRQCIERDGPARVLHVHQCRAGAEHVDVSMEPVRDRRGRIIAFIEFIQNLTVASPVAGVAGMVGDSPSFNRALEGIRRVAPSQLPVLLLGESGTGKELFARALHEESIRGAGPFVPVECSGLTASLIESELFGHEAGAFTGARVRTQGLVGAARGGTLFLDEIGDVPLELQVKLLRLLESGTYRRVGSVEAIEADFRLVCATHADLELATKQGRFRLDLYYRINAFPIPIPALRQRLEDLPVLCAQFLEGSGKSLGETALARLRKHDFPGNIRELRNLMQRAALLSDGARIEEEHLRLRPQRAPERELVSLEQAERDYLRWAVQSHAGDRASLADALGVSARTLYRKLAELGL